MGAELWYKAQNEGPCGVLLWHPCSWTKGFQESYLKFFCLLWPVDQVPQRNNILLMGGGSFYLGLSSRCQSHAGLQDYSNNSVPSFRLNHRAPIFYFLQSLPLKPPRPPPHHSLCSQVKLCVAWCCMQFLLINQCD